MTTTKFSCNYYGGAAQEIEAQTILQAAEYFVEDSFGDADHDTRWVTVYVAAEARRGSGYDDAEAYVIAIDPEEPDCTKHWHDWQAPHEIVGGLAENPGVQGHGGGVICHEVCLNCGCGRITDTWAQNPETGEQGLLSVAYEVDRYEQEIAATPS